MEEHVEIKDIVEQEKHKLTLAKIKKREDAITRKQFLKDCYKFWKEYKKVESPYFWWLSYFTRWYKVVNVLCPPLYYLWWIDFESPLEYYNDSWFFNKWSAEQIESTKYLIKRKSEPNSEGVLIKYY